MTPKTTADIFASPAMRAVLAPQNAPQRAPERVSRFQLDYVTRGLHHSVTEAHSAIQRMLSDIDGNQHHQKRWVSLLGKSGCGKTHLARKAIDALQVAGFSHARTQFWSWRHAKALVTSKPDGMTFLQSLHVLALDDIGAGFLASDRSQEFNADVLLELLEGRMGKWTIITSNLTPRDIAARLDTRIASRLYRQGNEIVDMSHAADYAYLQFKINQLDV